MKAPRFVQLGRATLQVLEAAPHDPKEAAAAIATLDALRPPLLLLDRSRADWDSVRAGHLDPYNERLLGAVKATGAGTRPDVLWREAKAWATRTGTRVGVIHAEGTEPPKKGLKKLDKLVKKEGFEAATSQAAMERFVDHYVLRVPELRTWLIGRRDETAKRLWQNLAGQDVRAVVLFAAPDADAVCARLAQVQNQSRPARP